MSRKIVQRTPWHFEAAADVEPSDPLSATWGYVLFYSDGGYSWDGSVRPPDEILRSPACRAIQGDLGGEVLQ